MESGNDYIFCELLMAQYCENHHAKFSNKMPKVKRLGYLFEEFFHIYILP